MIECPGCGGNLKFDIATQKMHCAFCDSQYDPYQFDEKEKDAEEQKDYEVTVFTCPQCGGELYSTDNAAAAFCSFCGASTILYSRISRERRPEFVIPFQKTKEDCKREYMKKVKKALFLPKEFKEEKYIDSFRGIYMPYWSYNMMQEGYITLKGEESHRSGDYIVHNHYDLRGYLSAFYHGITHDASSSFEDNISECLQPYNVKEKKEFTPGFLSGFYADVADVASGTYEDEAQVFAYEQSMKNIRNTKEFRRYKIKENQKTQNLHTKTRSVEATMFPVWFLSYRNKERVAYAAVNGQTGKVVADLPIAPKKYLLGTGIIASILFLLFNLFFTLKPSSVLAWAIALGWITVGAYLMELIRIARRKNEKIPFGKNAGGLLYLGIAEAVGILLEMIRPVSDWFYYGGVIFMAVGIAASFLYVIRCYNVMATRRLPQFDKKGGDDRA